MMHDEDTSISMPPSTKHKSRKEPLKAYRPITTNAWENPDRHAPARVGSAYANGRKTANYADAIAKRKSPRNSMGQQGNEKISIPINKRATSANRHAPIRTPKSSGIRSAKASTGHLKSSLDPDFLELFNNS